MSNAVNFTDGLDGLAGLISATAFAAYGGIALLQGQVFLARFCFTIVGALFGFLWFNVHPAQLIMGDTGSLSLGATLGVVALMTGQWLLLPLIAIIPVSEALSVDDPDHLFQADQRLKARPRFSKWPRSTIILNCSVGAKPRSCSVSGWSVCYLPCLAWHLQW